MKRNAVVEVLHMDACPFWKETLRLVEEVNKELKAEATVKSVEVTSEQDAKRLKFPGSPTVRIDGVDIDPSGKPSEGYIGCRIYMYNGKTFEFPPKEMVKNAFKRLLK